MKWRPARIGDRVYDLCHLHPFSFDFVVAAKDGKPEQRYGIDVIFSLHCFSRGIAEGAAYLADLAYADSREVRLFEDDIPQRRPKSRKPIRFSVIAYNVAVGKAIKVPK